MCYTVCSVQNSGRLCTVCAATVVVGQVEYLLRVMCVECVTCVTCVTQCAGQCYCVQLLLLLVCSTASSSSRWAVGRACYVLHVLVTQCYLCYAVCYC